MSTGPKPAAPRRTQTSMAVRRDTVLDGPTSLRSRCTRLPRARGKTTPLSA
jgi:hypothetical protein